MNLNEYQDQASRTALYDKGIENALIFLNNREWAKYLALNYCVSKLNGEAGEALELVAKAVRDFNPDTDTELIDSARRYELIGELGDALWYIANAARELGITLEDLAEGNLAKLRRRQTEGKLHGSGSDR
jgi:NTP pyrophosphatase (non-canonical NTP hydrolase)